MTFTKNFLSTNICLTFFDESNKKVISKMKDVSQGKIIDEFVGLKSKIKKIN